MGLSAVLGAVLAGAAPIVAVDPVPAKRELALRMGATHAVHPDDTALISDVTGGGARVAVEAVGSVAVLAAAFAGTGRGGRTVAVGLPHPAAELRMPALPLVAEGKSLIGSYLGGAVPARDIPELIANWRAGRLPVELLHTGTLPLDSVNEAFDALADGQVVRQLIVP